MAGNGKFELISGSTEDSCFARNYLNGHQGTHAVANLDRLGSFRNRINQQDFSTGTGKFKGNSGDLPPLSQCLLLEPITLGDQKSIRSGELRRALGFSFGSISKDNTFEAAHSKPTPTLSIDELKRFRASIQEGIEKARTRVNRLDDSLNKLVTYLCSRRQRMNEKSSGLNLLKMGAQSHRKSPDLMTQKLDDRGKNFLIKRARTPVEGQGSGILRQPMILGKEKDMTKASIVSSDSVEEKIRRLPAGGESWDKKMKRKRSVSNVSPRPVDGDIDLKRAVHGRVSNNSGMPSSDARVFRSGSFSGVGGNTKPDGASVSGFRVRPASKNEMEKASLSRELAEMDKERILLKGNNRSSMRDESHLASPILVTRGKDLRAARAGPPKVGNSSSNFPRMPSTPEECEQPLNVSKNQPVGGINNRKRALPSESSSPTMVQWVGQRPQKISRIRRTNIISPTSNDDGTLVLSEGCIASDYSTRTASGVNATFPVRSTVNNTQQLKVKNENTPSPGRLSGSEEIGAGKNQLKEGLVCSVEAEQRGVNRNQHVGSPGLLSKKNKLLGKGEAGDGVRRQGRSGRGSFSRGSMSALGEKLDSPAVTKPVRCTKPCFDKNGSKSGRPPLKKHSERKGFTRPSTVPNGGSPDCTVEPEDDHEDLLAAAQLACNTRDLASSSSFWKKMEPIFSLRANDKCYLLQQKDILTEETHQHPSFVSKGEKDLASPLMKAGDLVNQVQDNGLLCGRDSEEGPKNITPLYQRVLSALVMEDELEELEESNYERNPSFLSDRDGACSPRDKINCNGDTTNGSWSSIWVSSQDDLWEGNFSYMHPEVGVLPATFGRSLNGSLDQINISSNSSSVGQYAQISMEEKLLSELQSIGLQLETVPNLAEGEDEISEDIVQLEKKLHLLAEKKISCLERIQKAVEEENKLEERVLEQVAVNRLIELAYKKLLAATQESTAARLGVSKVPRLVPLFGGSNPSLALAFAKRTLARCRKFEETGKSCFSEPALRDVILAGQPSCDNFETIKSIDNNIQTRLPGSHPTDAEHGLHNDKPERVLFESHDPILNRGKKKEVLLDDVGNTATLRSSAPNGNTVGGGAKGKRSERERDKAKSGRPSITNLLGERKAKSKPKQKGSQLSTHPVQPSASGSSEPVTSGSRKGDDPKSSDDILDSSKEGKDLLDFGADNDFGGHEDLGSWLNFDEDNLLDHDSEGLAIPMDDLSGLFGF